MGRLPPLRPSSGTVRSERAGRGTRRAEPATPTPPEEVPYPDTAEMATGRDLPQVDRNVDMAELSVEAMIQSLHHRLHRKLRHVHIAIDLCHVAASAAQPHRASNIVS